MARKVFLIFVLTALCLGLLQFSVSPVFAQTSTCSPINATITAPFSYDGAGTFCWQSTNLGGYINSWNLTSLTVNGVNETNIYVASGSYPAKVNGYYYVSYSSSVSWGHFEAGGTSTSPTSTPAGATNTPTRTPTPGGVTNTPTRTPTLVATATSSGNAKPSAGCGKTRTLQNGTITISSGGVNRTYILNVPSNYNNTTPYRLVMAYHWLGGTATDVATGQTVQTGTWAYYGLLQRSNNTTIFIAPQGIDNGWANTSNRDINLTDAILSQVEGNLCVDQSRVFAIGFSYGAAMSYSLACARPTVFRAVAIQSGGVLSGCSGGTSSVAYLGIHGVSDSVLNISGGRSMRDRFVTNNGYAIQNPSEPSAGSLTHKCTKYTGGNAAYPVEWCAFDGGHIAAPRDGASGDSGSNTWVPAEVWAFFTQF